jgi:hypothetical protein
MFTIKNLLKIIGRDALISFVAIFIAGVIVIFLSNEIKKVSDSVALNHRLETELKKRTELFDVLKHDVQIVGTNDTKIENAFLPSDNILEFVSILDSLATKNSLTQVYHFDTPTTTTVSAPFPISAISYSNSFAANVFSFSNYLKDFDKLPYFTKIEGFNISAQNKLGWLEVSNISFRATLYTKTTQ